MVFRRSEPVRIDDMLYCMSCSGYDYGAAETFFGENPPDGFSCSAVSKGTLLGRNYDWAIGDKADIVVRTPAEYGKHASLGVSSSLIPSCDIESGADSPLYQYVPFMTMDGVNDAGFACCVNGITVSDRGKTSSTRPGAERMSMALVVRYLLDNAGSVHEAVELLRGKDIHSIPKGHMGGFEMHYMLMDSVGSAAAEFIGGKLCLTYGVRILSNFHLTGVYGRKDLSPHSHGLERFGVLSDGYAGVSGRDSMMSLLSEAWYSRTYDRSTVPFWYSEYYNDYTRKGEGDFRVGMEAESWMEARIDRAIKKFDGKGVVDMWHTGHSSVYDISDGTLDLIANETGRKHFFRLRALAGIICPDAIGVAWRKRRRSAGWFLSLMEGRSRSLDARTCPLKYPFRAESISAAASVRCPQ